MGQVATPLRAYLKFLKTNPIKYAFISISGGADGTNPKLAVEFKKTVEKEPIVLIDMHIADLLPSVPKPERKDTSDYRINNEDIKKLTSAIMKILRETIWLGAIKYEKNVKFNEITYINQLKVDLPTNYDRELIDFLRIYCLKALVQYTYITSLNSSLTKLLYLKRHDSTLIHRL